MPKHRPNHMGPDAGAGSVPRGASVLGNRAKHWRFLHIDFGGRYWPYICLPRARTSNWWKRPDHRSSGKLTGQIVVVGVNEHCRKTEFRISPVNCPMDNQLRVPSLMIRTSMITRLIGWKELLKDFLKAVAELTRRYDEDPVRHFIPLKLAFRRAHGKSAQGHIPRSNEACGRSAMRARAAVAVQFIVRSYAPSPHPDPRFARIDFFRPGEGARRVCRAVWVKRA